MMLVGVQEPELTSDEALTRTLRPDFELLGKNARAMYDVDDVGSTENTTLLLLVLQLEFCDESYTKLIPDDAFSQIAAPDDIAFATVDWLDPNAVLTQYVRLRAWLALHTSSLPPTVLTMSPWVGSKSSSSSWPGASSAGSAEAFTIESKYSFSLLVLETGTSPLTMYCPSASR